MDYEINEIIKDLKKYYKHIRRCKLCRRLYGIDKKECGETKNLCPLCIKKLKEKKNNNQK